MICLMYVYYIVGGFAISVPYCSLSTNLRNHNDASIHFAITANSQGYCTIADIPY